MSQTDAFAAWYALYPRKVARKSAEKAWSRCATSPEVIEQIMTGLRAQLPGMLKKDKEFIPHPSSWLNQRRWMDEIYAMVNAMPSKMRVIACPKCGDTGVVDTSYETRHCVLLSRCSCPIGQLPGVLAGVREEAL